MTKKPLLQIFIIKNGISASYKTENYIKKHTTVNLQTAIELKLPNETITFYPGQLITKNILGTVIKTPENVYIAIFLDNDDMTKTASKLFNDFLLEELTEFYKQKEVEEHKIIKNLNVANELQTKKPTHELTDVTLSNPEEVLITNEMKDIFKEELEKELNKHIKNSGDTERYIQVDVSYDFSKERKPQTNFSFEVSELIKYGSHRTYFNDDQLLFRGKVHNTHIHIYRWDGEKSLSELTTLPKHTITKLKKVTTDYFETYRKLFENTKE